MPEPTTAKERPAFSGLPIIVGWIAMLVFAGHASTHMVAAGDTWVALACGRHFYNHGVDTVEPFSANSHKAGPTAEDIERWPEPARWIAEKVGLETVKRWHPTGWVNQNWLTHVIFYWLTHESPFADAKSLSFNSLVYWKFAIYIIAVFCVYYTARLLGANPALSAIFACFAMFVGRSFLDIRPAGFSNLLVAVFLLVLALATYRNIRYIWLIVPIAVFWCNVHGGYIYVFIILLPFVMLHVMTLLPKRWTVWLHCSVMWAALYFIAYKLSTNLNSTAVTLLGNDTLFPVVAPGSDWFVKLLLVLVFGGLAITAIKQVGFKGVYGYHVVSSIAVFFCLLPRIFPGMPAVMLNYPPEVAGEFRQYMESSQLLFFAALTLGLIVAGTLLTFFKHRLVSIKPAGIGHTVAAGFVALVALIIFNPFHLTNLTHTFVISVSKHAEMWRSVNEWHPAFEWTNPVGDEIPFLIMYIIAWLALAFWAGTLILTWRLSRRAPSSKGANSSTWTPLKIDLPLMVVAALTVYMAIRSRRFIPIAAIAACPVLALLLDQIIRALAAVYNFYFYEKDSLVVPRMSRDRQLTFTLIGALVVLAFALPWGLKFKHVYLDAWPSDTKLNSVFMRMTASDAKPFYALEFIRDNKLSGKMFNYWTEGGFISWGQQPDPNTGRTPLQLFMDGRAQAAYEPEAYRLWSLIMGGGPLTREAKAKGRTLSKDDYVEIGRWLDRTLTEENVWVVLMPSGQEGKPFVKGLEHHPDWHLVFVNNRQRLYINRIQGQKFFQGKNTIYPNHFTRDLILAHNMFVYGKSEAERKKGLDFAFKAFHENPSQVAMREILMATRFSELVPQILAFVRDYYDNFPENKVAWIKQHGYNHRITAALVAGNYLENVARKQGNTQLAEAYKMKNREYELERAKLLESKIW